MDVTLLGTGCPQVDPRRMGPASLVQAENNALLVDCGSGVISRLLSFLPIEDISAAVLSHLHGAHIADIEILRYMLRYRKRFDQVIDLAEVNRAVQKSRPRARKSA